MVRFALPLIASFLATGCNPDTAASAASIPARNTVDIASLSDEFDSASSLSNWSRIYKTEGWGADQLSKFTVENGQLVLVPKSSTWYQDYRGVLVYKDIPGDFIITTKILSTGRDGRSAPRADFSLGGIMIRSPRKDNAATWQPGGENYVFLSIGSADQPGNFQFEVKTTQNSNSNLEKIPARSGEALLRVVRVGPNIVLLRNQGGSWVVHKRYQRPDMPPQLQVGLTVYTDYSFASKLPAKQQNGTAINGGNPDLVSKFDYVRYQRPNIPSNTNIDQMSDEELLKHFAAGVPE